MSVTIQPIHPDDGSLRPIQPKPLTAEQVQSALDDGEQVDTSAAAKVSSNLYAGVDPTIGDGGIITSMTVKPAVEHKADLRAQIDGVVNSANGAQPTQILVADMQAGGDAGFSPTDGALASGAYITPDHPQAKPITAQPIKPDNKPNIIIGGV